MADKYQNFEHLANSERNNVDYRILCRARGSDIVIVAPHGGAIEPGTSEIADAVAAEDFSFYAFEGLKPDHNGDLHITSSRFDEPRCVALIESSVRVITIHGEASNREVVYLGGRDMHNGTRIQRFLNARKFSVLSHMDRGLQGQDALNICNLGQSGAGVQLEIARGLRSSFFVSLAACRTCVDDMNDSGHGKPVEQ